MNYRSKLTLSLIILAILSSSLALFFEYKNIRASVERTMVSKTKNVAVTISGLTDTKAVEKLVKKGEGSQEAHDKITRQYRQLLKTMKDSNVFVESIYLLNPNPKKSDELLVTLFVPGTPVEGQYEGMVWSRGPTYKVLDHLNSPYSPRKFVANPRGLFLSGFAPLFDDKGNYLATLGVTIYSSHFLRVVHQILEYQVIGVFLSLLVAASLAYFLMRHMSDPLKKVKEGVRQIVEGDFSYRIQLASKDEFYTLATSINKMSQGLAEKKQIQSGFSRHMARAILGDMKAGHSPFKFTSGMRKVTLLHLRFKHFPSRLAEENPERFFELFNQTYLKFLSIFFCHQGSIEAFYSDQLLVEFGIPLMDPNQEENAMKAALKVLKQVHLNNQLLKGADTHALHVHLGIHTTEAIVGAIGSSYKKAFTVVEGGLKTVSTITSQAALHNYTLLISESTVESIKDQFPFEEALTLKKVDEETKIKLYTIRNEI